MAYSITRACPSCGRLNRIPAEHLAHAGRCGSCKSQLPPLSEPLEVDTAAFDGIVRESPVPVFVDFWAAWCGPCRIAGPEVEALAREMSGKAVFLKVDTDRYPELATRYRIETIPNFVVLRNGRVVTQRSGVAPKKEMRGWLDQNLAA